MSKQNFDFSTADLAEAVNALLVAYMGSFDFLMRGKHEGLVCNCLDLLVRLQRAGLVPPDGTPPNLDHLEEPGYFERKYSGIRR